MEYQTLYAHMVRDVLFISLIFEQKQIGDAEMSSIKTRWSELADMTQTLEFRQVPHVIRELAINEIDHLEQQFQSIKSAQEFEQRRAHLEKRTKTFLTQLQKMQPRRKAA